jgi:two-component system, OmpR family, sensor histidine kinase TctE
VQPSNASHDELQRILSVFHHEAGTPVALIASVLRHLRRSEGLTDDHDDLVSSALRQIDVLERLLDQVRVANQEQVQLEAAPVDLVEVVGELVDDLGTTVLDEHPCEVHAPDGAVVVDADAVLVRQMLSNLLDNAARYSEAGKQIEVEVGRDGTDAVIRVTDQGTGIADADLERIFERHERATDGGEGLGLGLYVVWRIVDAHGGGVEAVPAPEGPGARFVVRLPAHRRHAEDGPPGTP